MTCDYLAVLANKQLLWRLATSHLGRDLGEAVRAFARGKFTTRLQEKKKKNGE